VAQVFCSDFFAAVFAQKKVLLHLRTTERNTLFLTTIGLK
jgi:hypothetical protein